MCESECFKVCLDAFAQAFVKFFGKMSEWFKVHPWKGCVAEMPPGVRIPIFPKNKKRSPYGLLFLFFGSVKKFILHHRLRDVRIRKKTDLRNGLFYFALSLLPAIDKSTRQF